MTSSRTRMLFDRWSASYDDPTLQRLTYRPIHDAVIDRVERTQPESVLDLGCGTGLLTERLARRFPDAAVVGVDLSAGMLTEAAARVDCVSLAGPSLARADAERLPFRSAAFDVVVCTESFHWYPRQDRVVAELARVLRPGGRVVIASIATITGVGDRLLRRGSGAAGSTIRALPPLRLRRLLASGGFEVVHQRRVPRLGPFAWPVLTEAPLRQPSSGRT